MVRCNKTFSIELVFIQSCKLSYCSKLHSKKLWYLMKSISVFIINDTFWNELHLTALFFNVSNNLGMVGTYIILVYKITVFFITVLWVFVWSGQKHLHTNEWDILIFMEYELQIVFIPSQFFSSELY